MGSMPSNGRSQHDESHCGAPVGAASSPSPPVIATGERLVFTVAEAGALLGVSRAFAYELVARGELPVIRLGRRILVPKAALLQMVDAASRIS